MDINGLDILILAILAFAALRGFIRGLFREIAALAGVIFGFFVASHLQPYVAPFMGGIIKNQDYAHMAGYLALFLGGMLAVYFLSVALAGLMKRLDLAWLDRLGGGGVGLIKGVLFSSILLMVLTAFLSSGSPLLKSCKTGPYLLHFSSVLVSFVPEKMKERFLVKSLAIKQYWEEAWERSRRD